MKRVLLVLLALFCASPVWAAITFDTATTQTGTSSTTGSHTIAADANIAIVCLSIRDVGGAVQPATAVTVGGVAATFLSGQTNAGNVMRSELWYKLAPSTGSQTIASTGHASTDVMLAGIMTFKGVAQSSTFNTALPDQASSSNMDAISVASAVGEMGVLCGASRGQNTASPDATSPVSTERLDANYSPDATNYASIHGYTEDGAATSINMQVDLSASVQWAVVGVSMRAAPDTSAGPLRRRNF